MSRRALTWALATVALFLAAPAFAADTVYYYSSDTLHSEVVVTDQNRNVVERTHYAPYGQVLDRDLRDGPAYSGHAEDPETGLVYMQQRYYDPEAGRFLSADPVGVDPMSGGNFNRYAYASDNPYTYDDPFGEAATQATGRVADEGKQCSTGSHICGSSTGALVLRTTQIGSPSVSEAKAAAIARTNSSGAAPGAAATAATATWEQTGGALLSDSAAVASKFLGVVGMALSLSGDTPQTKDQQGRKEYVIGEGMMNRVIPFAVSIGADYYHGVPSGTPESGYMSHNRAWINKVMDQHGAIINIGPEPGREFYPNPTSPYYRMELEQIKIRNYPIINANLP